MSSSTATPFQQLHFPALSGDVDTAAITPDTLKGKAVLLVNVASYCGFTPQLGGLKQLHDKHKDKLSIVCVPCNDFGAQEPDADDKLVTFYRKEWSLPAAVRLTAKQPILGPQGHPLFRTLEQLYGEAGMPNWNFHKFLFSASGEVVGIFPGAIEPSHPDLAGAVADAAK